MSSKYKLHYSEVQSAILRSRHGSNASFSEDKYMYILQEITCSKAINTLTKPKPAKVLHCVGQTSLFRPVRPNTFKLYGMGSLITKAQKI